MLDNIVRQNNKTYFIKDGKKYLVKRLCINCSGKRNKAEANNHLADNQNDTVIWASDDDRKIVICAKNDLGTDYVQKAKPRTPWCE